MNRFCFCFVAWLAVYPASAFSDDHPCAQGKAVLGQVDRVVPRGFVLAGSDQIYALAGLTNALDAGAAIRPGEGLSLYQSEGVPDRYGRLAVQVFSDDWVQGDLLRNGKALGSGLGASGACWKAMLRAEKQGEAAKTGFWADENGQNIAASNLEKLAEKLGHFVLVTGKVASVGDRTKRLYLNFGQKWSQDFTVSVVKKGLGAFNGDVAQLTGLKNKTVRVRGILEERQGPLIRLIHEAQIEIIE